MNVQSFAVTSASIVCLLFLAYAIFSDPHVFVLGEFMFLPR